MYISITIELNCEKKKIKKSFLSFRTNERRTIFNCIKQAYEKADIYLVRFETIRNNYEIDTKTDPNILKSERGLFSSLSLSLTKSRE